ncbi:MAG TPA: membrane protein insertase YidC [Longimicrobiaceae bacterium]|nr:membrane protein insertase YidC [Longimicrobiaceae bacterium]
MEKRLILAVLLMSAVIMLTNVLFPAPKRPVAKTAADTTVDTTAAPAPATASAPTAAAPAPLPVALPPQPAVPGDTVVVSSELYRYAFSTRGAALVAAELLKYPSYTRNGPVELVPEGVHDFLAHRLAVGRDTLDLSNIAFTPSTRSLQLAPKSGEQTLRFSYAAPSGLAVELDYTFRPDRYSVAVSGRITGLPGGALLLTELGPSLAPNDPVDRRSEGQMAVVYRTSEGKIEREPLQKIEGRDTLGTGVTWVGVKDKYFVVAQVAGDSVPLRGAFAQHVAPLRRTLVEKGDTATVSLPRARVVTALPLAADGAFAYTTYVGPQEYHQLAVVGYNLAAVTQYSYAWLEPIIRPFVAAILAVVDFFHKTVGISYGWVLVLIGVLMRVVYWPFNARAMRSQMKNAVFAPMMKEIKEKYKDDPKKQQEEMVKLYREHGVNPISGCLPMIIPYPVLITLFFVFENTIAFRGASFLWLPDLSLADPLYILPFLLIASMFALQVVSMKISGADQNPQAKMMMYVMPIVMGFIFFNLPSGLNVYYVTTNIASMPQQLLLARERKTAQEQAQRDKGALAPTPPPARNRGSRKKG